MELVADASQLVKFPTPRRDVTLLRPPEWAPANTVEMALAGTAGELV